MTKIYFILMICIILVKIKLKHFFSQKSFIYRNDYFSKKKSINDSKIQNCANTFHKISIWIKICR